MTSGISRLADARLAAGAAAIAGDAATLYHVVSGLMGDGVPFETVLFDVLVPAEREVGDRWQFGDFLMAEEHAATATLETVVSLMAGAFDRPDDGPFLVVAAVAGDRHSLAGRVVAAHLLYLGHRTTFLGADVPAPDLYEYLELEPPSALVLSAAMVDRLVARGEAVRVAHSIRFPSSSAAVPSGRKGSGPGRWGPTSGSHPRRVAAVLDTWSPDPERAERQAVDPSPGLVELMSLRSAVLAEAEGRLAPVPGEVRARARDELSILLGSVEASLFVGDTRPTIETLAWQRTTLEAHGVTLADQIPGALRDALRSLHPAGAEVLAAFDRT